jgi:diacylglycerol kinase (ATP)
VASHRRPLTVLVNPTSGGKVAAPGAKAERPQPSDLLADLRGRGLTVDLHVLEADEDPEALAAEAAEAGRDVVVAGGDGTVRPAAIALVGTDATLGIIPLGSWNNIARGCGVPDEPTQAVEVVAGGSTRLIDVGLAWHPNDTALDDEPPPADAIRFFEAAGVGLDAAGFGAAQVGDRRGLLFALRSAWRALRRRRTDIRLVVDGKRHRTAAPAISICNGPYYGLGMSVAPDANPSDGLLDVVVFSGMSRSDVIRHYLAVARGRARHEPRVSRLLGQRLGIAGVRRTLPAHADGESIGVTPVAFAVLPGGLRLFGPADQAPGSPLAAAASAPTTRP